MQLNPRQLVTQFAHILQEELFPLLETVSGALSPQMELLASVTASLLSECYRRAGRVREGLPATGPL